MDGEKDNKSIKIHGCVKLPTNLNMRPFMAPIPNENIGGIYDLYGVLIHEGSSEKVGHYKAYVKTQDDIWFCNDDDVCFP